MTKKYSMLALGLIVALPAALSSVSAFALEAVTLRLAHNLDPSHVVAQTLDKMAADMKELSGGKMKLRIYPGGQMGGPRETLEMLQQGALDMTKGSASEMEAFESAFSVFSMPYLFRSQEHFNQVLFGEIGRELMQLPKEKGFLPIAGYVAGERSFYAGKPIQSPADMKGMKIRVVSTPTTNKMIELLGGSPAPISFGEVYTALQQGVIDGAENNEPSYYQTRHVEVAKHYSEDRHTSVPDYLVIATQTWEALSEEQREILMKTAEMSEKFEQVLWEKEVANSRKKAAESGATFYKVDKTAFREALQPIYDDAKKDPKKYSWIERIEAVGK